MNSVKNTGDFLYAQNQTKYPKEEDIEIRGRRFRFYFQNRYTLISLAVDLLTGIFYIFGSLASLTKIPDRYGTYFYLAGAIFLTIRPILRIVRNIFIYDEKKQ